MYEKRALKFNLPKANELKLAKRNCSFSGNSGGSEVHTYIRN
jgi:hypothetical protein